MPKRTHRNPDHVQRHHIDQKLVSEETDLTPKLEPNPTIALLYRDLAPPSKGFPEA
jgi:hypothetical protein